jgi:hypothetical protein
MGGGRMGKHDPTGWCNGCHVVADTTCHHVTDREPIPRQDSSLLRLIICRSGAGYIAPWVPLVSEDKRV